MKKQLFALALVTAAGCFLAGCSGIAVITGNGIITEKTFDPGDISRLTTAGYWKITLDPNADRNQCTIVIDENLLEELAIKSGSGRLQVTPLHNRGQAGNRNAPQLKQMPEKLNFSGISQSRSHRQNHPGNRVELLRQHHRFNSRTCGPGNSASGKRHLPAHPRWKCRKSHRQHLRQHGIHFQRQHRGTSSRTERLFQRHHPGL